MTEQTTDQDAATSAVASISNTLRDYAEHYVQRDWVYTRKTNIRHIRRVGDFSGYDHPVRRLGRLAERFVRPDNLSRMLGISPWRHPIVTARVALRTPKHLPDGVLDHSGVITYREETGEYLQMVQPSVGSKIADVLDAHPDLPAVQALAAEIQRVWDLYGDSLTSKQDEADVDDEAGEEQE